MKKARFVVIVLICIFLARPSLAKELNEQYFRQLFFDLVSNQLPWPKESLVITNFVVEPKKVSVPDGYKEVVRLKHQLKPGSNNLLVDYLFNGRLVARVRILGYVEVMLPVVVLKHPLPRHAIIKAEDLATERRPLTRLAKDVVFKPEEAIGLRTKISLRAGKVLRRSAIEVAPVIKRGSLVRIIAEGKNFTVTAIGEARQDGRPGEIIRVRNLSSKREIFAQVIDEKTVKVSF